MRFNAPCAGAERVRSPAYRLALIAALCAVPLHAQRPTLRVTGGASATVDGARIDGAAAFPVTTLAGLGFQVTTRPAETVAWLDRDTLRFWTTSPFFRAGASVYQLTTPLQHVDGALYLPEQFFIQWLPAAYPQHFEFRGGALTVKRVVAAQPAVVNAPRTVPARDTAKAPRVVVIDPGHGGRDPGSTGPNGLAEKHVALLISQRLASILRERGYEVHMTRTTDTLIALADRPKLANQWRGDRPVAVFLSIHTNALAGTSARGFETFFLSEARTEDERRVAEMENEAVRYEDRPHTPAGSDLDQILHNLRSDFLLRMSNDLATVTQQKLAAFHPGPNRGVKRAGFYVLVGAIMPAVLIETAFISHRDEAALLGTQSFQQKIAWGIADSVDEFFRRNEHLWVQHP